MLLDQLFATPFLYTFGRQGVLVFVIIPTILAAGFYFAGQKFNLIILKAIAAFCLLAGIGLGIYAILQLQDPLYSSYHDLTNRSEFLHYAILGMPVVGAIALGITEFFFRRNVDSRL